MAEGAMGEFSVFQFFANGDYEEVLTRVDAETAMRTVVNLTQSIGGRILGTTVRVIITDGWDFTCFDWVFGKGVIFPTEEQCDAVKKDG